MKAERGCGSDAIPMNFRTGLHLKILHVEILRLFNKTLECGDDNIDPILRDVIIQFLYKKGDKSDCNNVSTLSLINHIGKVLERMMRRSRLDTTAETLGYGYLRPKTGSEAAEELLIHCFA